MEKIVAFFPEKDSSVTPEGYILKVEGKEIEADFGHYGNDRSTDLYDLDVDKFPTGPGIFVFEGRVADFIPDDSDDCIKYVGQWRAARLYDLSGLVLDFMRVNATRG